MIRDCYSSNDEFRDAFYAVVKGVKYTGAASETVALKRPFAQVNVGTSDLEEFVNLGGELVSSTISVTGVANRFSMFDNKATKVLKEGEEELNAEFAAAKIPAEKLKNVNNKEYDYLAMAYILVPDADGESSSTTDIEVTVTEKDGTKVTLGYEGATVQRNRRTNLVGSFLTSDVVFDVVVDDNFDDGDNNYPDTITEELLSAAKNGGYVKLTENVTLDATLYVEADMKIDLGEYTITNQANNKTTDVIVVRDGATLILDATTGGITAVGGNDGYAIISEGKLIINSGVYRSGLDTKNDGNCTIYARKNGSIYIHGGDFSTPEGDNTTYVINKKDGDRATTIISIDGGTFKNFNPADNPAEGAGTNFLAEGYKTLSSADAEGNVIYTVVKKSELETMIEGGISGTVTLTEDVVLQHPLSITEEVTINLNGKTITGEGLSDRGVIEVTDNATVTIKGDGTVTTSSAYPVLVDGGTLNLEGGSYTATNSTQAVYVRKGVANISGGYYEVDSEFNGTSYKDDNGNGKYVLNCLDKPYDNGTANIVVTGGTFKNFNPADNVAEGAGTNFLAEGYKTIMNDGDYVVVKNETVVVSSTEDLTEAIKSNNGSIFLKDGNFTLPKEAANKTLTITGTQNTKIEVTTGLTYANGASITFDGITIQSSPQSAGYTNGFADFKYATFNNCVIDGTLGLDFSCEFNTCTFNIEGNYYNVWTWGAGTATFNDCTFNCDGKALLVYANVLDNATNHQTVNITDCVFNDNGDDSVTGKAAIEITSTYAGRTYDVIIENSIVNGFSQTIPGNGDFNSTYGSVEDGDIGTSVWGNKCKLSKEYLNVNIDGVDVY